MGIFEGLSLWPWFLAAAHSFAATIFFGPRLLRGPATPGLSVIFYVWSLGGAAAIVAIAGILEKSNAGLLANQGMPDIVKQIAMLAVLGALVGLIPTISALKLPTSRKHDGT